MDDKCRQRLFERRLRRRLAYSRESNISFDTLLFSTLKQTTNLTGERITHKSTSCNCCHGGLAMEPKTIKIGGVSYDLRFAGYIDM